MKTILNMLSHDITASIRLAHASLSTLSLYLTLDKVDAETRGDLLEAIALLGVEIELIDAGKEVDDYRRLKLSPALLIVREIIRQHAWTALACNSDAETADVVKLVGEFETARRDITTHCADLEGSMILAD